MGLVKIAIRKIGRRVRRPQAAGGELPVRTENRKFQRHTARPVRPACPNTDIEMLRIAGVHGVHEAESVVHTGDRLTDALGGGMGEVGAVPVGPLRGLLLLLGQMQRDAGPDHRDHHPDQCKMGQRFARRQPMPPHAAPRTGRSVYRQ